jgi:hypothetical protein
MRSNRGFVPHWLMMMMLIGAAIVIVAAIVIPILLRMFAK